MQSPGYVLLGILVLTMPFSSISQIRPASWEYVQGDRTDQEFRSCIQLSGGLLALPLGYNPGSGYSANILTIDYSTGKVVNKIPVPVSAGTIEIQALLELPDASLFLAGSQTNAGNKVPWFAKMSLIGEYTQLDFPAGQVFAEILQVAMLDDDHIAIYGLSKEGEGVLRLCTSAGKLVWSKNWDSKKPGPIRKIAIGPDKQIGIVGNTAKHENQPAGDVFALQLDQRGNETWRKYFGEKLWEEVNDVAFLQDGGMIFCGETNSSGTGKQDMWIMRLNAGGFKQWERTYGGREEDRATALLVLHSGNLLVAGTTLSMLNKKGATKFATRIAEFDPGGNLQWEADYGGIDDEYLQGLLQLHNGGILATGWTKSTGNGGKDGWALFFNGDPLNRVLKKGVLEIDNSKVWLNTPDGILRPGQRTFLSFDITNQEAMRLDNIRLDIKITDGQNGLFVEKNLFCQPLFPGMPRIIYIPVQSGQALDTKDNILQIDVFSGPDKIKSFKTSLKTLNPRASTLRVANVQTTREGNDELSPLLLSVEVQNDGDVPAEDVQALFFGPKGLLFLNGQSALLGNILPKSIAKTQFRLQKTVQLEGTNTEIQIEVRDKSGNTSRKNVQVRFDALIDPGQSTNFIVFTQPNEARTKIVEWSLPVFSIEATLGTSATSLNPGDAVLKINGEPLTKSKMDEEVLSPPSRQGPLSFYAYARSVPLKEGENRIKVEVKTPQGIIQSNEILINYRPKQPNLHLLSIGIPHRDLKFTTHDAEDFANAFANQAGPSKVFGNIYSEIRNTRENTRNLDIRTAMEDLRRRYASDIIQGKIHKEDVLMLFISSHGKTDDNKDFKILASDYDTYGDVSNIDYKRDILDVMHTIDCKKFIFIDACHSGSAEGARLLTQARIALEEINAAYPGLNVMTSSQMDELSYEDESWGNGAFTEALLEAFQGKSAQISGTTISADKDGDKIISFGELYEFLKNRIPDLVRNAKQNRQTPAKISKGLGDDIPLFILY
jgi:hypothetical protein